MLISHTDVILNHYFGGFFCGAQTVKISGTLFFIKMKVNWAEPVELQNDSLAPQK